MAPPKRDRGERRVDMVIMFRVIRNAKYTVSRNIKQRDHVKSNRAGRREIISEIKLQNKLHVININRYIRRFPETRRE